MNGSKWSDNDDDRDGDNAECQPFPAEVLLLFEEMAWVLVSIKVL